MKALWSEQEKMLPTLIRLNRKLLDGESLKRASSALRWLSAWLAVEVSLNLVAPIALGSFIHAQWAAPRFALPALALDVLALVALAATVGRLAMALQASADAPIVARQAQLAALRVLTLRGVRWTLLLSPLAWTPLLIVALKALFDVDAWSTLGTAFLALNAVFGFACLLLGLYLSRRLAGSRRWQILADAFAGRTLAAAQARLAGISAFAEG